MSGAPFLHLVSGASAAGAVSEALRRLGRDEEVIAFLDCLSDGPLCDVDTGANARVAWWAMVYDQSLDTSEAAALNEGPIWKGLRDDPRPLVFWHGPHANERLYALRACWWFRDQPTRLHEVRLGVQPPRHHRWATRPHYSAVSVVGPEPLVTAWNNRVAVGDLSQRAAVWEALRNREGDWYRELEGDEIVHRPLDVHDPLLIDACAGTWTPSLRVIGRVLAETPTGDGVLVWRIRECLDVASSRAKATRTGRDCRRRCGRRNSVSDQLRPDCWFGHS